MSDLAKLAKRKVPAWTLLVAVSATGLLTGVPSVVGQTDVPIPTAPIWECDGTDFCSATVDVAGVTISYVRNADGDTFITWERDGTQCASFGTDKHGKYFSNPC